LEVGVGTGRIARPLLARGVHVTGLDLSRPMLALFLANLPAGAPRPSLVQGAVEQLPLAHGSFDAVVTVHVLQLIPDWRTALAEIQRVLSAGGAFLSGYEARPPAAPGTRLMEQWRAIVAARSGGAAGLAAAPGLHDFADIQAALVVGGARFDQVQVGAWHTPRTLARHLETIEHRTWAATWDLPDDFFQACLAELRAWAVAEYGAPERELVTPHHFVWQRFTW
jgi:SAM-dependent methyltransferase